jgi:hypothetical protein
MRWKGVLKDAATSTFEAAMGCALSNVAEVVYADGLDVDRAWVGIGLSCRLCDSLAQHFGMTGSGCQSGTFGHRLSHLVALGRPAGCLATVRGRFPIGQMRYGYRFAHSLVQTCFSRSSGPLVPGLMAQPRLKSRIMRIYPVL